MLPDHVRAALLRWISDEWNALPDSARPWGCWVRECAAIRPDAAMGEPGTKSIIAAWFLDERGLRQRSVDEFVRFRIAHYVRPWYSGMGAGGLTTQALQIGLAAFAPYSESTDLYLESQWSGRHGHGDRITVDKCGEVHIVQRLWIS